jgi:hypothetical protein
MTNDEILKNNENPSTNYRRVQRKDYLATWEDGFWLTEQEVNCHLREAAEPKHVFDLEERTAVFGEAIIHFAKKIPHNPVNNRLVSQLVGAGTSVGANYCEADDGVSKSDFRHKNCHLQKGSS